MGFLSVGTRGSLFLVHSLGLFPLVCLVQLEHVGYVMLYSDIVLQSPGLFLMRDRKGVDTEGRGPGQELGQVKEGKV